MGWGWGGGAVNRANECERGGGAVAAPSGQVIPPRFNWSRYWRAVLFNWVGVSKWKRQSIMAKL